MSVYAKQSLPIGQTPGTQQKLRSGQDGEQIQTQVIVRPEARLAKGYYNDGIQCLNAGRIDRAEQRFRTSLSYDSLYIPSIEHLSQILKQRGKADSLYKSYFQRAEINPDNAIYMYVSTVLDDTSNIEQALQRVIWLDSTFYWGYYGLGRYYLQHKRYESSISNLRKAIELNPAIPDAQLALGMVYEKTGDTARAIWQYEKTLNINPKVTPEAYLYLGFIYAERADTTRSMQNLKEYLAFVKQGNTVDRARTQLNDMQAALDHTKLLEEQKKKEEQLKKKKKG
jgi:tetratricopeptide (TPR) repeat protein